jgi:hypothetical protein
MKDARTHIRVHNGIMDHPKVEALSDGAFRTLFELWCWCSRHLTDGAVSKQKWNKSGTKRRRDELLAAGLVEQNPDGSVHMHDYEKHQNTSLEVMDIRDKKAAASVKANHTKWHVRRGITSPDCKLCLHESDSQNVSHVGDGSESVGNPERIRIASQQPDSSTEDIGHRAVEKTTSSSSSASNEAAPSKANEILAAWLDLHAEKPPTRVKGQMAREIRLLLEEGIPPDQVMEGCRRVHQKAQHPSTLASFVNEVRNPRKAGNGKPALDPSRQWMADLS